MVLCRNNFVIKLPCYLCVTMETSWWLDISLPQWSVDTKFDLHMLYTISCRPIDVLATTHIILPCINIILLKLAVFLDCTSGYVDHNAIGKKYIQIKKVKKNNRKTLLFFNYFMKIQEVQKKKLEISSFLNI